MKSHPGWFRTGHFKKPWGRGMMLTHWWGSEGFKNAPAVLNLQEKKKNCIKVVKFWKRCSSSRCLVVPSVPDEGLCQPQQTVSHRPQTEEGEESAARPPPQAWNLQEMTCHLSKSVSARCLAGAAEPHAFFPFKRSTCQQLYHYQKKKMFLVMWADRGSEKEQAIMTGVF